MPVILVVEIVILSGCLLLGGILRINEANQRLLAHIVSLALSGGRYAIEASCRVVKVVLAFLYLSRVLPI